jgi:hypothetical protein
MAKPSQVTLSKKEQAQVLKAWKTCKNARTIATVLKLPRYQVMFLLQSQGLATFSEGSYR